MMTFKTARKYGPKIAAVVAAGAVAPAFAATSVVDQIFAAIDLTTVSASVLALGVLIIGVAMAFKGVDLGKRGIKKV